jgi:hypothetical protein
MNKPVLFTALAFALLSNAQPALAKTSCDEIDAAISATEDFAEKIAAGDVSAVKADMSAIRKSHAVIAADLGAEAGATTEVDVKMVEDAITKADYPAAANAALNLYRNLTTEFAKRLPTTLDIAMQDYSGFQLRVLASMPETNWTNVETTVAESSDNWNVTKKLLKDKALLDLGDSVQAGLTDAAKARNGAWLASVAQIQLDSVDLLEHVVKNTSKGACQ